MPDFSRLSDGSERILDLRPMSEGKPALVLAPNGWISFDGTLGQIFDSKPLTKEEIENLIAKGILSQEYK